MRNFLFSCGRENQWVYSAHLLHYRHINSSSIAKKPSMCTHSGSWYYRDFIIFWPQKRDLCKRHYSTKEEKLIIAWQRSKQKLHHCYRRVFFFTAETPHRAKYSMQIRKMPTHTSCYCLWFAVQPPTDEYTIIISEEN